MCTVKLTTSFSVKTFFKKEKKRLRVKGSHFQFNLCWNEHISSLAAQSMSLAVLCHSSHPDASLFNHSNCFVEYTVLFHITVERQAIQHHHLLFLNEFDLLPSTCKSFGVQLYRSEWPRDRNVWTLTPLKSVYFCLFLSFHRQTLLSNSGHRQRERKPTAISERPFKALCKVLVCAGTAGGRDLTKSGEGRWGDEKWVAQVQSTNVLAEFRSSSPVHVNSTPKRHFQYSDFKSTV